MPIIGRLGAGPITARLLEIPIRFFDEVRERMSNHPGVVFVSVSSEGGVWPIGADTIVDDMPVQLPGTLAVEYVHDDYFAVMNQPVLEGREFSAADRQGARQVAVVSEDLGRYLAESGPAIGRLIRHSNADYEIAGIAADFVGRVGNPEPLTLPDMIRWNMGRYRALRVQAASDRDAAMRAVSAAVTELDPEAVIDRMQTLDAQLLGQMAPQQFGITVLGGLGAIVVLLTAVGVYVLAASISNGRRRELGIRAALGAGRRDLGSIVLGETLRLAGLGVLAGLVLSWAGADLIRALLFGVTPLDVPTFAVISGLMLLVALLASLRPAVAAMRRSQPNASGEVTRRLSLGSGHCV